MGPLSYPVRVQGGDLWRRHVDHLRGSNISMSSAEGANEEGDNAESDDSFVLSDQINEPAAAVPPPAPDPPTSGEQDTEDNTIPNVAPLRYLTRTRGPPDWLM